MSSLNSEKKGLTSENNVDNFSFFPSNSSLLRSLRTMPGLAFASYFLYAYISLPVAWKSLTTLHSKRYDICPLVKCISPLVDCLREPSCRTWLEEIGRCSDPRSDARKKATQTFAHVQNPEDPVYCQYQSFDRVQTETTLAFLECTGRSGCLAPASSMDICADLSNITILPLSSIPPDILQGTWKKLHTTGWDLWPCQWTEFWPPAQLQSLSEREPPPPESWMMQWPNAPQVWRMDLFWQNPQPTNLTFHMDNEMYPSETWEFTSTTTAATLRTRAVMWGTEAHENWYLLDYNSNWQTMLIYYCAYTKAVDRFDSMAFVLRKDGGGYIKEDLAQYYETLAKRALGEINGNLQRIPPCDN